MEFIRSITVIICLIMSVSCYRKDQIEDAVFFMLFALLFK
jgi:hypothetical protein